VAADAAGAGEAPAADDGDIEDELGDADEDDDGGYVEPEQKMSPEGVLLCAWPTCGKVARPNSKYCSRNCSNKNARARHAARKRVPSRKAAVEG
jgi:hypothetical protein